MKHSLSCLIYYMKKGRKSVQLIQTSYSVMNDRGSGKQARYEEYLMQILKTRFQKIVKKVKSPRGGGLPY